MQASMDAMRSGSGRMFHPGRFAGFEEFCPIDLSTEMPGT
jgi:hypothetical protein